MLFRFAQLLLLCSPSLLVPALASAQEPSAPVTAGARPHHVLFQLTSPEPADWTAAMHNVRNLIHGFAPEPVEVEVVVWGLALPALRQGTPIAADLKELSSPAVHFLACGNSMRMQHLEARDLAEGVGSVPSGVVEITRREEQGWTYIKVGR